MKNMNKKVLIVEDDTVLANALSLALKDKYEMSLATDGKEAEEMIAKDRPDLVLLVLLLPIKNGFEVLRSLRANETTRDVPVVILTNFEQETSIEEGMKMGAKDYIVKANIDIKDVPGVVAKYI